MKFSVASVAAFAALALNAGQAQAGPIAMGLCYSACNAGYVTCCASAGTTAGTFTLGLGVPAALAGCSIIQGALNLFLGAKLEPTLNDHSLPESETKLMSSCDTVLIIYLGLRLL
ncbi:hypothetical protein BN14_00819 [Rhizoctonia solani AG-1 IB]|uniref:Hydrophobin n=1 Tax=Thanatephorus cucumeris (strain AG1-IB / isolate 7/3/14) TaxID=1108050 RepID=M5BI97_THACB|nr:hypothetical protein BN14_00819 [Rhizoctonia solani AG-1 IB]